MNYKAMQEDKFPYLPARGRIYKLAVEDTAVDMLDDYEEEIAAILSTPLDPAWYPDEERHLDIQIRDGSSELVEQYLDNAFISEKYVLPDDEEMRSEFISDVSRGNPGIPRVAISGGPGGRRGPEGGSPMKAASTSRLQVVSCSPDGKDSGAFKMTPQEVKLLLGDCLALFPELSHYGGLVDCILIDPPNNTRNPRLPYEDCRSDGEWYDFIYPRLAAAYPFLSNRGCIAVHINDNQLGSLLRIIEEIFGRRNQLYIPPLAGGQKRHRGRIPRL